MTKFGTARDITQVREVVLRVKEALTKLKISYLFPPLPWQPGASGAGGLEDHGPAQSRDASSVQQRSSAPENASSATDGNSTEMMSWINNNQMVVIIGCAVLGIIILVIVIAVVASIRARAMRRAGTP